MTQIKKLSPIFFKANAIRSEERNGFQVAVEYPDEGRNHLVDLSHVIKWDVQDRGISSYRPMGIDIPSSPLESRLKNKIFINRMNHTQASIWHLHDEYLELPNSPGYTDMTDAFAALAIVGENVLNITEKLSYLSLFDPKKPTFSLTQGPFAHVACQIVSFNKNGCVPGILLMCMRGYAKDMVEVVMKAGDEFGLKFAGIAQFDRWIKTYSPDIT